MFQLAGTDAAGRLEMRPMVDASYRTALEAGAKEMPAGQAFLGGHAAIVGDPQDAAFGLHTPSRGFP